MEINLVNALILFTRGKAASEKPVLVTACRVICAVACLAAVLVFRCGTGHAAPAAAVIEYLYVEANEGDSSGGHTAIRFGRQTFHFQHETPGIIRIRRLDSAAFNHMYAKLGNRAIRESLIAVSAETYTLLLDAVTRLLLIQDAQVTLRDELQRDIALFERLLQAHQAGDRKTAAVSLPIKGLGYFVPHGPADSGTAADVGQDGGDTAPRALLSLKERILAAYGERFIEERIVQARARIKGLVLRAAKPPATDLSRDAYPGYHPNASARYYDALSALSALEELQVAPDLRQGAFLTSDNIAFRLEPQEALALKRFADQQEEHLVSLVNSARPDWGFPFLVGMARLAAARASLRSARLVFLDIFPAIGNGQGPGRETGTEQPDHIQSSCLPAMNNERLGAFLHWRREFFQGSFFREADYATLERAGNLLIDSEQALATGTLPGKPPEASFPSREGRSSELSFPDMDEAALLRELGSARLAATEYDAALARLYSYNLVRRNCVTEIFAVINSALERHAMVDGQTPGAPEAVAIRESYKRLGGFIDASGGLTFIPFVSAGKVETSYTVIAAREQPSYRHERLMEMVRHESPLLVFLRESNTITSTIYRPTPDDSAFLFFTDDALLLRPLFGVCNLLVGLGDSLLGLAVMPLKGTERLLSGVRGMLFSLPELAFVNLRKGSMAYVEQSKD